MNNCTTNATNKKFDIQNKRWWQSPLTVGFIVVIGVFAVFEFLLWIHGCLQAGLPIDVSGVTTITIWANVLTVVFIVFSLIGMFNIDSRIKELNDLHDNVSETNRDMRVSLSELQISAAISDNI